MTANRRSYDIAASGEAQGNLQAIVANLETLIADRDAAVKAAMADFQADGVDGQYRDKEARWNAAAGEVRSIIALVRSTLDKNDQTATQTLSRARAAVEAI